jgi:hypothetical protein
MRTLTNIHVVCQMTMSELVDEAVKRGAGKELIISRLRHWVREGLIVPVGEHHPGSGRHRYFEDTALKVALALNALADFNVPIGVLRSAAPTLRDALHKWPSGPPSLFLVIGRKANGKFSASLYRTGGDAMAHSDRSIVLDLAKIWVEAHG